jgi:hypothetical protein
MSDLVDRYLSCWNETLPEVRADLVSGLFSADATYVDPLVAVQGRAQLDATIAAVQSQFPGFVFSSLGPADEHHAVARFTWGLGPRGGEPVVIGFDVVATDADGRIERVVGFLDRVPA